MSVLASFSRAACGGLVVNGCLDPPTLLCGGFRTHALFRVFHTRSNQMILWPGVEENRCVVDIVS